MTSMEMATASASRTTVPDWVLRGQHLGFSYPNGPEVLADLNFDVERGSRVAVIGPSGCGKSTLLGLLAGLYSPTSGNIVRNLSGGVHPLSMMFQKETLLPWLTVRKNVTLARQLGSRWGNRKSKEEARQDADELLALVGLEDAADQYPYQLSGGMRRRVQLLSAVYPRPQILFLDEPFSSLDEPTRIGVHRDVLRITAEFGMTMILVTHDLAEAITLSDEIVVLSRRPTSVYRRHTIPFGTDRDVLGLREDERYQHIYATIWHELSEQMGGHRPSGMVNGDE